MKTSKLFFILLLLLAGMQARSQVYTVDISTGVDSTGTPLGPPNVDPRWSVKKPSTSYVPVRISTGVEHDPGYAPDSSYYYLGTRAWLSPFLWTQSEINAISMPPAFTPHEDDMKVNPETGTYIYRLKFNISWPACKRPNSAKIRVHRLTAIDEVYQVRLNGQSPVNVGALASYYIDPGSGDSLFAHRAQDLIDSWTNSSPMPPPGHLNNTFSIYTIMLNPSHLVNGDNYLYVTVKKNSGSMAYEPTAFTCEGYLEYTYGADPLTVPTATVTGANHKLCNVLTPTLNVSLSNLVGVGAQVAVTATSGVSATPSSGSASVGNPFTAVLHPSTPATYTITLTSNSTTTPCTSVKTVKTYACNIVKIKFNLAGGGDWDGRLFGGGSAGPEDTGEESIPGFETKWMLEELDDATDEPLYRIITPANWNTDAGESNYFNGFHADNSYSGDVTELEGDLAVPGVFSADRVYRITRYYKSTAQPDWEEHSVTIGPGYDQYEPIEEAAVTGINKQETSLQNIFTVYPNPGKDIFRISMPDLKRGYDMVLYDAVGKRVLQLEYVNGQTEYTLDLSGYAKGIYFLCMPEANAMQKIIVE